MLRKLWVLRLCVTMQLRETLNMPSAYAAATLPGVMYGLIATYKSSLGTSVPLTSLVLGAILTTFWAGTIWGSAAVVRRERFGGTLARVLSSIEGPSLVLIGRGLGASVFTAGLSCASVLITVALAQPANAEWQIGAQALPAAGAAVVLGSAIGYVVGSLFVLTRYASQISSALFAPVALLAGLMITPEALPAFLQWAPWSIGLMSARIAAESTIANEFWSALSYVLLLAVVYFFVGARLLAEVIRRARAEATLDLY